MCTSSMNRTYRHKIKNKITWTNLNKRSISCIRLYLTPGTISAFPSSLHSMTLLLICSLTSLFISPVSPEKRARKP